MYEDQNQGICRKKKREDRKRNKHQSTIQSDSSHFICVGKWTFNSCRWCSAAAVRSGPIVGLQVSRRTVRKWTLLFRSFSHRWWFLSGFGLGSLARRFVFLVRAVVKARSGRIGLFLGAGGARNWRTRAGFRLLLDGLDRWSSVVVLLSTHGLHHNRLSHHWPCHNGTVVVVVAVVVCIGNTCLGKLCRRNGRHRWRIRGSDGSRLRRLVSMNADDGGTGEHGLLGGHRADDGVVAVDGGSHTAAQARRDTRRTTATIIGHFSERRVAQITWHEKVLIGSRTGERRNGWHERGRVWWGAVGHTRDVGNLNDIRSASQDGGSNGAGGFPGSLGVGTAFLLCAGSTQAVLVAVLLLAHVEPPDQADDDCNKSKTTDNTTGDSAGIATA